MEQTDRILDEMRELACQSCGEFACPFALASLSDGRNLSSLHFGLHFTDFMLSHHRAHPDAQNLCKLV